MKALVTGGTGFVGGHLIDRLLERGDTVTALVRSRERATALSTRGVKLVEGDLANRAALAEAVVGQGVVYHSAAVTGAVSEAEFMTANRDGTANLAQACVASGNSPRFVLVSSMAAGGPARTGVPRQIDGNDHPVTMYGRSKLASELLLREMPLRWTALRAATVYGPRDRENLLAIFKAARLGITPVFGTENMEVCLVEVRDLVDALVLAGTKPGVEQCVFYVNHPEILTSGSLVRTVGKAMGRNVRVIPLPEWVARGALSVTEVWSSLLKRKTILHPDKANEFYQEAWTADPSSFIRITGWTPRWNAADGLANTAAWYRAEGWL